MEYRLYCLKDGRILSTALIDAADDMAAIEAAQARRSQVDCELWNGSRLIAFIPASPEEA